MSIRRVMDKARALTVGDSPGQDVGQAELVKDFAHMVVNMGKLLGAQGVVSIFVSLSKMARPLTALHLGTRGHHQVFSLHEW